MVALLVTLAVPNASAQGIEEYFGARPPEADKVMPKFRAAMLKRGGGLGPIAFDRGFVHWIRLPAIADPSATPITVAEDLELGKKRWIRGAFSDAIRLLTVALRNAQDNGPATVQIPNLEDLRVSAMVALALSSAATGDASQPAAVMEELLRTYPDHVITRGREPIDAEQLWTHTRSIAMRAPRGHIRIEVPNVPNAKIYVNEVLRSSNSNYEGDLLPGTYRALVAWGSNTYRFDLDVESDTGVPLVVDLELQPVLTISEQWAGITLTEQTRRGELRYLGAVSRLLGGVTDISVAGLVKDHDRWYLTGKVYDAIKNAIIRSGRVSLGGPTEDRYMAELAAFLENGTRSPDIEPLVEVATEPASPPAPETATTTTTTPTMWPAWAGAGLGVGLVASGVYLVHIDGTGSCGATAPVLCPNRWKTALGGWTAIGFGAAAFVAAAYWYAHERGREPTTTAALVPTRAGAVASFGWRF